MSRNLREKFSDEANEAVDEFFEDEGFSRYEGIVEFRCFEEYLVSDEGRHGQLQRDLSYFDHCFVKQGGGGVSGDDYHGSVFFHLGNQRYLEVSY